MSHMDINNMATSFGRGARGTACGSNTPEGIAFANSIVTQAAVLGQEMGAPSHADQVVQGRNNGGGHVLG